MAKATLIRVGNETLEKPVTFSKKANKEILIEREPTHVSTLPFREKLILHGAFIGALILVAGLAVWILLGALSIS